MNSIADQLPVDIARQIHPDRRKNEAGYWLVRDQLLDQYFGLWIGFATGLVIASGSSPVTVFHAAEASGQHPFLICVGKEEQPCRIRRDLQENPGSVNAADSSDSIGSATSTAATLGQLPYQAENDR